MHGSVGLGDGVDAGAGTHLFSLVFHKHVFGPEHCASVKLSHAMAGPSGAGAGPIGAGAGPRGAGAGPRGAGDWPRGAGAWPRGAGAGP